MANGFAELTVTADKIKGADSALTSEFEQTTAISKTLEATADIESLTQLTTQVVKIAGANASFNNQTSLTAIISHILGVDIVANGFAELTVSVEKILSIDDDLTAEVNFTLAAQRIRFGQSSLSTQANLQAEVDILEGASRANLTASFSLTATGFNAEFSDYVITTPITDRGLMHFNTSPIVDEFGGTITAIDGFNPVAGKFGNAFTPVPLGSTANLTNGSTYVNLYNQSSWTVDFWFKPRELTELSFVIPITPILGLSNVLQSGTYQDNGGDQNIQLGWRQTTLYNSANKSASGVFYFGYHYADPNQSSATTYTYDPNNSYLATTFKHVAMVFENLGSNNIRTTFYINGVQSGVTTKNYSPYYPNTTSLTIAPTVRRVPDRNQEGSFFRNFTGHLDELRFLPFKAYTANFNPEVFPYDPPTVLTESFKVAYARLEPNFAVTASILTVSFGDAAFTAETALAADFSRTRSFALGLSSEFTNTTSVNIVYNQSAEFNSTFGLTTDIGVIRSAQSVIQTEAAVSTLGQRIRTTGGDFETTGTLTVDPSNTIGILAAITAEFTSSTQETRVRFGIPQLDSIATQLTVAFRNATGTVLLESVSTVTADVFKTTDPFNALTAESNLTITFERFRSGQADIDSSTEITAEIERIQPFGAEFSAETQQTTNTDLSRRRNTTVVLESQTALVLTPERTRDVVSNQQVTTTVIANVDAFKTTSADLESVSTALFIITKVTRIEADLQVTGFVLTEISAFNIDPFLQLKIEPETRRLTVTKETRTLNIASESRTLIIEGYE